MKVLKKATRADVAAASLLAQLTASESWAELSCLRVPVHECPHCSCEPDHCGHELSEDCIAFAIGASPASIRLYHETDALISDWAINRDGINEWFEDMLAEGLDAYVEACREFRAEIGLVGDGDFVRDSDREAAQLLAEGILPPGWEIVSRVRPRRTKVR